MDIKTLSIEQVNYKGDIPEFKGKTVMQTIVR